jgi:hypothetical protein
MFFFIGKFSLKFDLKNVISTNTKDFSSRTLAKFFMQIPLVVNYFGGCQKYKLQKMIDFGGSQKY